MTALWARIETLLGQVQKPARYIGCEDGAITPGTDPGRCPGCSPTPTPTRSACPTRASRSSTRSSTSATTPSPSGPTRPWTDLVAAAAPARPAAVLRRHPPRRRRVRPARLQPVVRAGVHERARDDRPRRRAGRAADRGRRAPVGRRSVGTRAFNPEPLADFVDLVVLGEGEEVVGEITEVVAAWIASAGATARDVRPARLAQVPGRVRAVAVRRRPTTDRRSSPITPRFADVPATVDKRTVADLGAWPYPKHQLVPLTEVVHDRLNVEVFRGLHPRLPLLPGRDDHPPGARAAGRPGAHDGRRRPAPHRLRRGQPDVAVDGRPQRHRAGGGRHPRRPRGGAAGLHDSPSTCRRCASTPSPSVSPVRCTSGRRSGLTFAPEAGSWRLRQVINKLITEDDLYGAVDSAFAAGLVADQAVLPHRAADRDRRGHARDRRAGPQLRRDRPSPQRAGRRSRRASAGSCPSRTRRSSGSGRTPDRAPAQGRPPAQARLHRARNVNLKWHDPAATVAEGILSRGDRRIGRVDRAGVARPAARSRSGASTSTCAAGPTRWTAEGLSLDWYVHRHRERTEVLPWSHLTAGLHEDFLWDDWQAALAGERHRRLPLDPVLRLRGVHRVRHRARRRLARRRRPAAARAPART